MKSRDDSKSKTAPRASVATPDPPTPPPEAAPITGQEPGLDKATLKKLYDFSETRIPFRKFSSAKLWQLLKKGVLEKARIECLVKLQRPGIDEAYARSLQTRADALSDYNREIIGELLGRNVSRKQVADLRKALGTDSAASRTGERNTQSLKGIDQTRSKTGVTGTRISANIDERRIECGWSQHQLAEKVGLDKKLVFSHLHGSTPHPKTLKEYAQAFTTELGRPVTANDLKK
jgi:ribosome-binding protein aMBF1 (putative translation factor)